jgi:flavin-dependent dehydrogenase
MNESFDVVIVGARCAGAPLATLLARAGVRVAVLEQATFPRDTPSTHLFEADALAFLRRLGVMDELVAAGAPLMCRGDMRIEDVRFEVDWPVRPDDVAGITSVRRHVLDPILARAAEAAGADMRMDTRVTDLVREGGRVTGVQTGDTELRARLVVGADGRSSTVAQLAGARRYNVVPNQRADYWAYFEEADPGPAPTFVFHRWADRMIVASPTDAGLYCVQVLPERAGLDDFKADLERNYIEHALACEPVAAALRGGRARRVGKILGMARWDGYFRDPSGPGWVLIGDAGHFKDPAPGRGIADAFMQADELAPAIVASLDDDARLDEATARFGAWRDKEFAEHYWFGSDQGNAGPVPAVVPEVVSGLRKSGGEAQLLEITNHRLKPTQVITPPRVLGATARLMLRPGTRRRKVLSEVGAQIALETKRRRLNRRPHYET